MQNQFVDLYRNGIKASADLARLSLENAVKLQERQLGFVRNILDENRRSAEALGEAKSIEELMSAQTRLAGGQLKRVAEFWSSFLATAAEQQRAWIEQFQSQSYELTSRTSEEIARTAANQVSRATGSVREAASARKSA